MSGDLIFDLVDGKLACWLLLPSRTIITTLVFLVFFVFVFRNPYGTETARLTSGHCSARPIIRPFRGGGCIDTVTVEMSNIFACKSMHYAAIAQLDKN